MKPKILSVLFLFVIAAAFKSPVTDGIRVKKTASLIRPYDTATYSYAADGKITGHHKYSTQMWESYQYVKNKIIEHRDGPIVGQTQEVTHSLNRKGFVDNSEIKIHDSLALCIHYKYDDSGINMTTAGLWWSRNRAAISACRN